MPLLTTCHQRGGAAVMSTVARGSLVPMCGCREHNRAGDGERAPGALLTRLCRRGRSQAPVAMQCPLAAHGGQGFLRRIVNERASVGARPPRTARGLSPWDMARRVAVLARLLVDALASLEVLVSPIKEVARGGRVGA
jgi:hypothetical protein